MEAKVSGKLRSDVVNLRAFVTCMSAHLRTITTEKKRTKAMYAHYASLIVGEYDCMKKPKKSGGTSKVIH